MNLKNRILPCVILFLLCMTAIVPVKAAGELDPSFRVFTANNLGGITESIIQPDGKILIYGTFEVIGSDIAPFVARLNANGTMDTSFNPPVLSRRFEFSYAGQTPVKNAALQSDGKILISGLFEYQGRVTGLIRLNPDGSPDDAFNNLPDIASIFDGRGLVVFPDDKILVTGTRNGSVSNILINTNGTISAQSPAPLDPERIQIQPNGRVLGFYNSERLYRLNQDLTVDSSFQPSGKTYNSVDTQPDGKIVAAGYFEINTNGYGGAARLNTDGTLDYTFGTTRPINPNGGVSSIRVLPDGKVMIGGFFSTLR